METVSGIQAEQRSMESAHHGRKHVWPYVFCACVWVLSELEIHIKVCVSYSTHVYIHEKNWMGFSEHILLCLSATVVLYLASKWKY